MISKNNRLSNTLISHCRIEVCGGIASGKTTFARLMSRIGLKPIYENFKRNPFWQDFYSDPVSYAFETEITFLLQHYNQIKRQRESDSMIVCDFSFVLDIAYAEMGLKGSNLEAFMKVYEEIKKELPPPTSVVHLDCSPVTELERIRKRRRTVEKSIDIGFLTALNGAIKKEILKHQKPGNVITINSAEKNFAYDESDKKEVLDIISDFIAQLQLQE